MHWLSIAGIVLFAAVFCFVLTVRESARESRRVKITNYEIKTDKLAEEFDNFRIVMFSDLHNAVFSEDDENQFLIDQIKELHPDLVVLAGDMMVCHRGTEKENARTAEFLNRLSRETELYYGVGNHEKGAEEKIRKVGNIWEDYKSRLSDQIHYMDNKVAEIKRGNSTLRLFGLELKGQYYRRFIAKKLTAEDLDKKLGKPKKECFNVLIGHNPDYFPVYADWGADLVLSGHNHGGLVRIPGAGGVISPRFHLFPKYDHGIYRKKNSCMVLSSGLGSHSINIRVNNYPEIVLLEINKKK